MGATGGVLARLKQPAYIGENRCMPCTAVNLAIATVLSLAVALVGASAASLVVGAGAGAGVFALSAAAIYLRGYLIPGTPTLTKRYMPTWMLAWFGKAPHQVSEEDGVEHARSPDEEHPDVDPEAVLMDVGALEECQGGQELCLTEEFRESWYAEIEEFKAENAGRDRLLQLLDAEDVDVEFQEFGDAFSATVDNRTVGTWESRPAFLADLGGANILEQRYEGWDALPTPEKSRLLNGLRLFIDRCPECGGVPEFATETVESCCSTHEVAAVSCTDCESRLFETRAA